MKKTKWIAVLLGIVVVLAGADPALAKGRGVNNGRRGGGGRGNGPASDQPGPNANFKGLLIDSDSDAKKATAGPFVVHVDKASGPKASRPSGEVDVKITGATEFRGERRQGRRASDYRSGDFVSIKAHRTTHGDLIARVVTLRLLHFAGKLSAFNGTKGTFEVKETDRAGAAWLAAHGDPDKVNFITSGRTKLQGDPKEDGAAELTARTSADGGTTLEALKLVNRESSRESSSPLGS